MEKDKVLDLGVGTKESVKLEAKPVKVISLDVTQKDFSGKTTDQLVIMVKHPDKEDIFQMYNVSYLKGSAIKTVGLSIYYDSDGQISKGTAVAELLRTNGKTSVKQLLNADLPTMISAKGFLAFKCY